MVDQLSHTLGRIEQSLETITKTLGEDRMAAATYRTEIRSAVNIVRDNVADLKNKAENTASDVAEMRPYIADYIERRAEVRGLSRLGHLIAALGGGGIALTVQWILKKLGS